jgi:hypothetical protein
MALLGILAPEETALTNIRITGVFRELLHQPRRLIVCSVIDVDFPPRTRKARQIYTEGKAHRPKMLLTSTLATIIILYSEH